jgi:hypothetical protein
MLAGRPGCRSPLGGRDRAIVLVLMVMVAACGGRAGLDPPKASTVQGVPIPRAAAPGADWLLDPTLSESASYLVPGVAFDDLRAWYDRQLPIGQPFGQWAWCDTLAGPDSVMRTYGDSQHTLSVSMLRAQPGSREGDPAVGVGVGLGDCHIFPG